MGEEDVVLPCDFNQGQYLRGEEVAAHLVSRLPEGVRCTIVCDCCHGGGMVDLPHKLTATKDGLIEYTYPEQEGESPHYAADVVMISTCRDGATAPKQRHHGVLTDAVIRALTQDPYPTYEDLLVQLLGDLRARLGPGCQIPQISSTRDFRPSADRFSLAAVGGSDG